MKILNSKNYDSELRVTKTPVIVYFYADWCGPCKMVSPLVETISKEYDSVLNVFKINVDNSSDIATKYGVMSIPTLLFMDKDKNVVSRTTGFNGSEEIISNAESIVV